MRPGDVITEVNNQKISGAGDVVDYVSSQTIGAQGDAALRARRQARADPGRAGELPDEDQRQSGRRAGAGARSASRCRR